MLKPVDIQEKEFEVKMRGYDRDQVDEFLDEIMRDMSVLYRDNTALTEEINSLKAKCAELSAKESAVSQSYELTKYQCEEMRKNAQYEAKEIIDKAHEEAQVILHSIENNKVRMRAFCEELLEKLDRM